MLFDNGNNSGLMLLVYVFKWIYIYLLKTESLYNAIRGI